MGLLHNLLGRSRRVTEPSVTRELPREPGELTVEVGNIQGVGRRERQEDSFAVVNAASPDLRRSQGLLAVVADGMGGMADGKEASQSAVEDLLARFRDCGPDTDIPALLAESVHAVSREVFRRFSGASGTTLAAVHLRGSALHWVSVGDSAIFLLRDGGVFQLNREHTFLNTLYARELEQDVICRERAEQDEDAHRLTSFVGIDRLEEVDRSLRPLALLPGDALLLCSDGVSGVLTPPELMEAMALRPEEGCALLEQMVLEKDLPAQDNFTGILISCK